MASDDAVMAQSLHVMDLKRHTVKGYTDHMQVGRRTYTHCLRSPLYPRRSPHASRPTTTQGMYSDKYNHKTFQTDNGRYNSKGDPYVNRHPTPRDDTRRLIETVATSAHRRIHSAAAAASPAGCHADTKRPPETSRGAGRSGSSRSRRSRRTAAG